MDSYADILAEARKNRAAALAKIAILESGGELPIGVTLEGLRQSVADYDGIIKKLGWRDNA